MAGLISESVLEEVRQSNNIVEVIGEYIPLKRQGKYFKGLCPFHNEKTASFTVTPDKQIFYCFGCNAGGDVFKFVMLKENLNFPEAVRFLAERSGISIQAEDDEENSKYRHRQRLFQINEVAAKYFNYLLTGPKSIGNQGAQYFTTRNLGLEVIEKFQLGFASLDWDDLFRFLSKRNVKTNEMLSLGLVRQSDHGKIYDQFRNRVMFPIWDVNNRVIAFGGRVLDGSLPKYLNSPETEIFSKSNVLYGLNFAVSHIRQEDAVIVMEGYMDVITAHQQGIENAVATLGTALTQEHGKLLKRYTRNIIMAFDGDAAGIKAAFRGLDIMQELGFRVFILTIPDAKDPDEYISTYGAQSFKDLLNTHVQSLVEFKLNQVMKQQNLNSITGKIKALSEILPNLDRVQSEVEKDEYLAKIGLELNISRDTIVTELKKYREENYRANTNSDRDKIATNRHNINDKNNKHSYGYKHIDKKKKAELTLVRLMMENYQNYSKIKNELASDFTADNGLIYIIDKCSQLMEANGVCDFGKLTAMVAESEYSSLLSWLLMMDIPLDNMDETLKDCVVAIRGSTINDRKAEVLRLIADAEKKQDWDRLNRLMVEYQQLL